MINSVSELEQNAMTDLELFLSGALLMAIIAFGFLSVSRRGPW